MFLFMQLGDAAQDFLPVVWATYENAKDPQVIDAALLCLLKIEPGEPRTVKVVSDTIRNRLDDSSVAFINSIPAKDPATALYLDDLVHAVTRGNEAAPQHAAIKLAQIGKGARGALPALHAAIARTGTGPESFQFRVAIECINGEFESPTYCHAAMLSDPDPATRSTAAVELTQNRDGSPSEVGLPEIMHALEHPRPDDPAEMRAWLIDALIQRSSLANRFIPLLKRIALDPNEKPLDSKAARRAIEIIEN